MSALVRLYLLDEVSRPTPFTQVVHEPLKLGLTESRGCRRVRLWFERNSRVDPMGGRRGCRFGAVGLARIVAIGGIDVALGVAERISSILGGSMKTGRSAGMRCSVPRRSAAKTI